MFRNNYQGGAVVEVFSGQGKDPVAKWKLCGRPSAIYKEYNKEVKGFVYCLEGSSQTVRMQMPVCVKMPLGLVQRFLVFQVNIPQCKDFSIELVITDSEHLKRRLHLSTVHKELSATPLHAKIPLMRLKRNIWSTLCLDLLSFAAQLFKGFLTLDGITVFATCKVRRIFTMKTEPTGMSDDDMFLSGAGLMDLIPRSCQFPPDVQHITQMLNMENLQKAEMSAGLVKSDCVRDHSGTARPTSYRQTRPQGVLRSASGSRASGPRPLTGRKSSVATDGMDRDAVIISNQGSTFSRRNQRVFTESEIISKLGENSPHGEPSLAVNGGTPGKLQPHPPADKQGSRKPRVRSAGRERLESSDAAAPGHRRQRSKTRERRTPPSSGREGRQQPVIQTEQTKHLTADEVIAAEESSRAAPNPAECLPCAIRPGSSSDLQVWSSWESNEGSEPQLSLQEEVFIFSSQPHSPKGGQGQGDQEKTEMGDEKDPRRSGRRHEARPEDDFIGSESDEDKSLTTFQQQRTKSNPATPRTADPTVNVHVQVHSKSSHNVDQASAKEPHPVTANTQPPSSGRSKLAIRMAPTRCLSPGATLEQCGPCGSEAMDQALAGKRSVTVSRKLLQESILADSPLHKAIVLQEEEDKKMESFDSSHYDLHLLGSHRMNRDDDEEELQMLASLKREQEEDECRALGLRVSQIHQCNVSLSMSSDDASTWTHISMPATQGHHYQNEINPLLHSNPREWMDVLSPPIMTPSQQRRSGNTLNNKENQVAATRVDESVNEEVAQEDDYLNLLYDPCLNCYFDPKTGKYYELA